jgi:multiple sugar transport system substrate-binding protein
VKGQVYGLAFATNGKELWYNADLLAQAGVSTPKQLELDGKWTWDALLDLARKLTKVEGGEVAQYGFGENLGSPGRHVHPLWAWGADWYDKGFTKPAADSPPFLAATEFAVDLVARHRVATTASVGSAFNTRKVAMMINGSTNTRAINEQVMQKDPFKVEMALLPKGPGGRAVALANNCNYLIKAAKAPEGAWLLYKHFVSQDVQPIQAMNGNGRYTANKRFKPTVLYPYEDAAVYEASARISRPLPLIVRQAELDAAWQAAWADMVSGKQGVRPALTTFQERATLLLRDGGCIC